MANSKQIAGLVGPQSLWLRYRDQCTYLDKQYYSAIHMNGALLFVAGLSILRA
jgi:hypothetical protein